jgi:hypothetical protein
MFGAGVVLGLALVWRQVVAALAFVHRGAELAAQEALGLGTPSGGGRRDQQRKAMGGDP